MGWRDFPAPETGNEQGNIACSSRGSDPEFGHLQVPIESLGCRNQIVERDGAGECACQGVTQSFGAELGQWQQLDHARAGDLVLFHVGANRGTR